jgi:outer membrane biosynthesis protein TonB
MPSRVLSNEADAPWSSIEIAFTVDARGRPREVELLGPGPALRLDRIAQQRVGGSIFRPAVVDGRVVFSRHIVVWKFQYDPEEL